MKRSPLDLAAVATAAVPGLAAAQVGRLPDDPEEFDAALVVDSKGGRWRVRSPKHADASLRLETELRALGGLSPAVRATLPFAVPSVAGTVRQGELKTFVYHHLDGHVLALDELLSDSTRLGEQLGRALASIHSMDRETVERAGLPSYDAEEFRRARLSELDQVAASGKVPPRLLRRWEAAMEDVSLWRFNPATVHGDLHEEQLFIHEGRLVAVTGWSDLHVGDPAEDLAWLLALDDQRTIDAIVESYSTWRGDKADPHLMTRATLAAEFALARWLARALTRGDDARVAEAQEMLAELDANLSDLGDKPIGLVEAVHERPEQAPTAEPALTEPSVTELPARDDAAAVADSAAPVAGETEAGAAANELPAEDGAGDASTHVQAADGDAADGDETEAAAGSPAEDSVAKASLANTTGSAAAVAGADAGAETTDPDGAASGAAAPASDEDAAVLAGDSEGGPSALPAAEGNEATAITEAASKPEQAAAAAVSEVKEASKPESSDEDDSDAVITDADVAEPATEAISIVPAAAQKSEAPKPQAPKPHPPRGK